MQPGKKSFLNRGLVESVTPMGVLGAVPGIRKVEASIEDSRRSANTKTLSGPYLVGRGSCMFLGLIRRDWCLLLRVRLGLRAAEPRVYRVAAAEGADVLWSSSQLNSEIRER
jgi:hypothetical protein